MKQLWTVLLLLSAAVGQTLPNYTLTDVAKHATSSDCWMVLNTTKIYNFTKYISLHPGGSTMVSSCGTDATSRFNGVGHSNSAVQAETPYLIGNLIAAPPAPLPISVTISPTKVSLQTTTTQQFTATAANSTKGVTWKTTGGTISTTGLFTPKTAGSVTITATSVENTTKSATAVATVTTTPPPPLPVSVSVSPTSATVLVGTTQQFIGATTNSTQGVKYTTSGSVGTISTTGLFVATKTGSGTIIATSVQDPTKNATAQITVTAAPPPPPTGVLVTVTPLNPTLVAGTSVTLTAAVQNSTGGVTWNLTLRGSPVGVLNPQNPNGMQASFIAAAPGTATITATSIQDASKSASVTVTVTASTKPPIPPGVTLTTAEVAKHATASDCWVTINGSVYNVTPFIPHHPNAGAQIIALCGQDASGGFTAAMHSSRAYTMLPTFLLGQLVASPPPPSTPQCTTTQSSRGFVFTCPKATPAIPSATYTCSVKTTSTGTTFNCSRRTTRGDD